MTSSARASMMGGTTSPSILAVLALMTTSKIVACSVGKSCGREPLEFDQSASPFGARFRECLCHRRVGRRLPPLRERGAWPAICSRQSGQAGDETGSDGIILEYGDERDGSRRVQSSIMQPARPTKNNHVDLARDQLGKQRRS